MLSENPILYISMLALAALAIALGVLLAIIKIRNTAKVSFISFFSAAAVVAACISKIAAPYSNRFYLLLLLAAAFLIPYCVMLAFGKPKETDVQVEQATAEVAPAKPAAIVEDVRPEEISLVETGRGFVALAADSFLNPEGAQALLDAVNKACVEATRADGGAILMVDDFDDVIAVKSFTGEFPPPYKLPDDLPHKPIRVSTSFKYAQFPFHDNIFGEVASSGRAELITSPASDDRIFQNGPEDFLKLGSFMFIPLKLQGKDVVVGLLALSRSPGSPAFTEQEYNWALTLASFAESALKTTISFNQYKEHKELTKESDIASDLQVRLLPKKLPAIPGVSLGTYTEHAPGVCSDVFDVVPARADRTSFILMDAAGKGVNSVLVMSMLRAMLRLIVNTTQTAGTVLSWANKGICSETNFDHFASVVLINYDATKRVVQFATGGTIPVLRFSAAKNELETVSVPCEPIGVEKATVYKDIEFTAARGDIIISYSDGIAEALNAQGKQYPAENIAGILRANNKLSGKDIANLIKSDIKKFIGTETLHDDQTLLVVKIQ